MNKNFLRFVALLLIPCLLQEPAAGHTAQSSIPNLKILQSNLSQTKSHEFSSQALVPYPLLYRLMLVAGKQEFAARSHLKPQFTAFHSGFGWVSRSGLKLCTIRGTRVYLHSSLLVLISIVSLYNGYYSQEPEIAICATLLWFALIYGSIAWHEFFHIATAQKLGIQTGEVTLTPIGGIATIESGDKTPQQHFWVTLMGPVGSFVLAGLAKVGTSFTTGVPREILEFLVKLNTGLGLFNLFLPLYPADGGRLLHSLIWMRTGDVDKANRITLITANIVTSLLVVYSAYTIFFTSHPNPVLLAIALVVRGVSKKELELINEQPDDISDGQKETKSPEEYLWTQTQIQRYEEDLRLILHDSLALISTRNHWSIEFPAKGEEAIAERAQETSYTKDYKALLKALTDWRDYTVSFQSIESIDDPSAIGKRLLTLSETVPQLVDAYLKSMNDLCQQLEPDFHRQALGFQKNAHKAANRILGFIHTHTFDTIGHPVSVDITKLIQIEVEIFEANQIHHPMKVIFVPEVGLPPVWGDPLLLAHVWENLLSNASRVYASSGPLYIYARRVPGGARVDFEDYGHGIRPIHHDSVFEKGFTTKISTGHGLGLYLIKKIVENAGGSITFDTLHSFDLPSHFRDRHIEWNSATREIIRSLWNGPLLAPFLDRAS